MAADERELAMPASASIALGTIDNLFSWLNQEQNIKGFWDDGSLEDQIERKLLLIIGELVEAHEELRSNPDVYHIYYREDGKPEGFLFELADVFIRLGDLVGALGTFKFGSYVAEKQGFNQTRPHKHGREF